MFFNRLDYDHVRWFFTRYADRILLGSDIGWDDDQEKIGEFIADQEWPAR